jgi:hypothetical protein
MRKGTDKDWEQRAGCMTFPEAVAKDGTWERPWVHCQKCHLQKMWCRGVETARDALG